MLKVDPDAMIETFIHGTPTQCVSQLMELRKAGANNFVLYFDDFPKTESIELFSKQVWKKIT
jgi:alkanesulfonate monooxygenase SsuD/methylene tetrahydromethanopterin reductase-like flavin-dependent oxidoreductase (luciferase family)